MTYDQINSYDHAIEYAKYRAAKAGWPFFVFPDMFRYNVTSVPQGYHSSRPWEAGRFSACVYPSGLVVRCQRIEGAAYEEARKLVGEHEARKLGAWRIFRTSDDKEIRTNNVMSMGAAMARARDMCYGAGREGAYEARNVLPTEPLLDETPLYRTYYREAGDR